MSQQSFADLGVSAPVASALSAGGITTPFPIQRKVIGDVLAGRDVLAMSPTGSGKTLAFGVPIVDRLDANAGRQAALILAPTRELTSQIVEDLIPLAHARALSVAAVYGGVGIEKQSRLARRAHVIVATPGRLEDLIDRGAVRLDGVRVLVLDEADRMLDMGFRPAVDRIVRQTPRGRQTLFFSATLHGEVGRLADAYTEGARRHEVTPEPDRVADVEHRFVSVAHEHKVGVLVDTLQREQRDLALVFVRTKRGADRLVQRLGRHGVKALAMHGNKTQSAREKALARFEAGAVDTLVATDVAARGIDVDGITHVINFDPPEDRDGYVHRVGRTGRAGRTGVGITFVNRDQEHDVGRIATALSLAHDLGGGAHAPARAGAQRGRQDAGAKRASRGRPPAGGRRSSNGRRRQPASR